MRRKDSDRILDWRLRDFWRLCGVDGVLAGSAASSSGASFELSGGAVLSSSGAGPGFGREASVGASFCSDVPTGSSFSSEDSSFFFAAPPFLAFSFCFFSCSNYGIN